MNNNLKLVIISLVVSLALVGGAAVILSATDKTVDSAKQGTATLSIDKTTVDLGQMKTEEERKAIFTVTNIGSTVLRLWNVSTSCDCTFAKIKIGDRETSEFSMHGSGGGKNWLGEIPVGAKAEVAAIYRPYIMPVIGRITRQVFFDTNDPKNSRVELTVAADVE